MYSNSSSTLLCVLELQLSVFIDGPHYIGVVALGLILEKLTVIVDLLLTLLVSEDLGDCFRRIDFSRDEAQGTVIFNDSLKLRIVVSEDLEAGDGHRELVVPGLLDLYGTPINALRAPC